MSFYCTIAGAQPMADIALLGTSGQENSDFHIAFVHSLAYPLLENVGFQVFLSQCPRSHLPNKWRGVVRCPELQQLHWNHVQHVASGIM